MLVSFTYISNNVIDSFNGLAFILNSGYFLFKILLFLEKSFGKILKGKLNGLSPFI